MIEQQNRKHVLEEFDGGKENLALPETGDHLWILLPSYLVPGMQEKRSGHHHMAGVLETRRTKTRRETLTHTRRIRLGYIGRKTYAREQEMMREGDDERRTLI